MPDIPQTSLIMGITIASLKEAGLLDQVHSFIGEIKKRGSHLDPEKVIMIAEKYVDFYREGEA